MVGLCSSVSAPSLPQDSDLPRESGGEFSESCTHFRELPILQEAPTLLRDINKSLPKYLTSEITRYWKGSLMAWEKTSSTTFDRGVVWYKDSLWYPAIGAATHCIAWQSTWQRNNAAASSTLPQLCTCPCFNHLPIQVLYVMYPNNRRSYWSRWCKALSVVAVTVSVL